MKEYFTTIRHQSAVRRLGTRDLYMRILYSHVLGFTQAHGCWQGTYSDMQNQLEISQSAICRILRQLIAGGHVRKLDGDRYIAVADSNTDISDGNGILPDSKKTVAEQNPLNNPLYKDNNDSSDTHTHPRDAPTPEDVSFPDFCQAYRSRGGRFTAQQHTDSYALWSGMSVLKRQAVMAELAKPEGFWRPRPDWLLADYELPPPKNYNGSREFDDAVRTTPLVSASYNGAFGIYTLADAQKYGMQIKCRMN
ncbi:MAG: hypothetical protein IJT12_03845 [Paludibacteraceae bacterium]|nr:hypothetical protein [Paludibacteraceae bacterium]